MTTLLELLADGIDEVASVVYRAPETLQGLGWRRQIFSGVRSQATLVKDVASFVRSQSGKDVGEIEWSQLFEQLKGLKGAIDGSLKSGFIPEVDTAAAGEALEDLTHFTLLRLIAEQSQLTADALVFLDVFHREFAPELVRGGRLLRLPAYRYRLVPARFVDLFAGVRGLVGATLGVGGGGAQPAQEDLAIAMLLVGRGVLDALGFFAMLGPLPTPAPSPARIAGRQVSSVWPRDAIRASDATIVSFNVDLGFVAATGTWPSAAVSLGGRARVPFEKERWKGDLTVTGGPLTVVVGKDVLELQAASIATAELNLVRATDASPSNGSPFVLGERKIRLLAGGGTAGLRAEAEASAKGSQLRIKPSADDGFLKVILPADGVGIGFDVELGWSSQSGFRFSGGIGFHWTIPINQKIADIIEIGDLDLDLRGDAGKQAISASAAISGGINIGPVSGVIEQLGIQLLLTFPEQGGNLGGADLSFGFKPPKGLGLSVKASAVKGGGYLFFDTDNQQYAGVAQLEISGGFGITVVGVLTTRLPGNVEGFSLVLIVAVTLGSGIALGYGFFLSGLGGLLGVNRDYREDEIRKGISDGTIDSILFPPDPVKNARKVISDVNRVFPPAQNKFAIGLMARITWGQPKLIIVDLGVIVALPDVVITIIGRLRVELPDPEQAVLLLRMTFQGTLSFPKKRLTFDATLAGSRLLTFALTGQLGMLLKWGEGSTFALSVGGFHPKFQPPPELAITERMGIAIFNEKDLRLRLGSYFAITTNTLQLGAALEFYFAKELGPIGNFEVQAGLAFDAIVQFSPFHFEVSIQGYVNVARNGAVLAALIARVSLEGPGRWIVDGEVGLKFLCWEVRLPLHKEFGDDPPVPLPPAQNVERLVLDELAKPVCWTAALPEGADSSLMLRDLSADNTLVLHPFGSLSVRQRIAPLRISLAKFGESRIEGPTRIEFAEAVISGWARLGTDANDLFARGQFFAPPDGASDDQKVQEPEFETFACGLQGIGGLGYTAPPAGIVDSLDYETLVVEDPILPAATGVIVASPLALSEALDRAASERLAELRLVDRSTDRQVGVAEPSYVAIEADGTDLGQAGAKQKLGFTAAQNGTGKSRQGRRQHVVPSWDLP